MEKNGTIKLLAEISPTLCERFSIDLAYVFGSANSERFRSQSDIDIAVRFKSEIPTSEFFRLSALFEVELARLLRRKIDVSILNLAPPLLRYEVVKNGRVLFSADNEQRALFHIRTYRDYDDFCHAQNFYIQALRQRLQGRVQS